MSAVARAADEKFTFTPSALPLTQLHSFPAPAKASRSTSSGLSVKLMTRIGGSTRLGDSFQRVALLALSRV
jgi:hypothetical protein